MRAAIYLTSANAEAVSLTLLLSDKPYRDKILFPFFDGLIPEGWLWDIAEKNWKINTRDRMSLLLVCCMDCIGAVGVEPIINEDEYIWQSVYIVTRSSTRVKRISTRLVQKRCSAHRMFPNYHTHAKT